MPWEERAEILRAIRGVVDVVRVNDEDGTVCEALRRIKPDYFANGGDRVESNNAELGVEGWRFVYGIGGSDKKNSSSKLLKDWENESSSSNPYNSFKDITDMY